MSSRAIDPFFANVGKFLGVPPGEIRVIHSETPGEFTCFGPRPLPTKQIPDIPKVRNYCFTIVIKTKPPGALCNAYRQEYDQLLQQLDALIEAQEWDDVIAVTQRLKELEKAIRNCRLRVRTIKYCIYPDDVFEDPFVGGGTLPPRPDPGPL